MSRYAFIAACLLIGLHGFDRAESGRHRMHVDQLSQEDGEDMETGGNPLQQVIQRILSAHVSPNFVDYFGIMGVSKGASAHDIKQAYKALALKLRPDKVSDESLAKPAERAFNRVVAAYEVLGDETKRQVHIDYEAKLKSRQVQQRKAEEEYWKRKEAAATAEQDRQQRMEAAALKEMLGRDEMLRRHEKLMDERMRAAAMNELREEEEKEKWLQKKLQVAAQARRISSGDSVKVVRGEGEGWFGIVYKVKDDGQLKVCLDNSMDARNVPRLPEKKTVRWGHHTSHCAKVIEAAAEDLKETAQSLQRKIESIEKAEKKKRQVEYERQEWQRTLNEYEWQEAAEDDVMN